MPRDDQGLFDGWRKERASRGQAPPGFTDEVMAKVCAVETSRQAKAMATLVALACSKPGRVTMGTVAAAAFMFRVSQILSVFIVQ